MNDMVLFYEVMIEFEWSNFVIVISTVFSVS